MKLLIFLLITVGAYGQNEKSSLVLAKENIGSYIEKRLYPHAHYRPDNFTDLGSQKLADSVTVIRTIKHRFWVEAKAATKVQDSPLLLYFIFYLNTKMEVMRAERII